MGKICIFTGHRELPPHREALLAALRRHIPADQSISKKTAFQKL